MEGYNYEVEINRGGGLFNDEHDAIMALWLLAHYHDLDVNLENIKRHLDEQGFYEKFPLVIKRIY